jgi:hypothetical protein
MHWLLRAVVDLPRHADLRAGVPVLSRQRATPRLDHADTRPERN